MQSSHKTGFTILVIFLLALVISFVYSRDPVTERPILVSRGSSPTLARKADLRLPTGWSTRPRQHFPGRNAGGTGPTDAVDEENEEPAGTMAVAYAPRIHGQVLDRLTLAPLIGFDVRLQSFGGGPSLDASSVTDDEGRFTLAAVVPDPVIESAVRISVKQPSARLPFHVESSYLRDEYVLLVPELSILSGRLVNSRPLDMSGLHVRGILYNDAKSRKWTSATETDESGRFSIPERLPDWATRSAIVLDKGGALVATLDVPLDDLRSIGGAEIHCNLAKSTFFVGTPTGQPIAKATVVAARIAENDPWLMRLETDANGNATLLSDERALRAFATNDEGAVSTIQQVTWGQENVLVLESPRRSDAVFRFMGQTVDEFGAPLQDCVVSAVFHEEGTNIDFGGSVASVRDTTGPDGNFELIVPIAGVYRISAYSKGRGESASILLATDNANPLRIVVERLVPLYLELDGVTQIIDGFDGWIDALIVSQTTGFSERFYLSGPPHYIAGLPVDHYTVAVRASSLGMFGAAEVSLNGEQESETVKVVMDLPMSLDCQVTNARGVPLCGVTVTLLADGLAKKVPGDWISTTSDNAGQFSLPRIPFLALDEVIRIRLEVAGGSTSEHSVRDGEVIRLAE